MVLDACTTTIAILQSVSFYNRNKELLQKHQILLKLFTFKSVLGLNFFQSFVISMLAGHGKLRPNKYMTFHDINTGLASLILACEMPTFAILMIVAFSPQPYKYQGGPAASPLNAIFDACNISDLLSALFRGPMRLVREQQRQILRQNSMRIELVSSYDNEERMGDKGAKVQMIMQLFQDFLCRFRLQYVTPSAVKLSTDHIDKQNASLTFYPTLHKL
ncbi:hypothetical protein PTNB73_03534 [Pyrenophora teres f. teres]|nr:hypothetical protein HRS9139_02833 [Pyrenophora teres f. teres]KAE8866438.1 hypothetical protein PTNB29_03585 [Pyrenophora teres f. teres]KAE8872075.1 hypothetical protein PTNB73_03534 [Pyrenophora teres f. teres]